MNGFAQNIQAITAEKQYFRQVLYTGRNCQLVIAALQPTEEIGMEAHLLDQFVRVEAGTGDVILNGIRTPINKGSAVIVPAGTELNIINTGSVLLKLYTVYAAPNHLDKVTHRARAEADADDGLFDDFAIPLEARE
jgi:mannose-6-phosphate isomerase-like protein (cupin superfamily)